jgi:hypothetical protein
VLQADLEEQDRVKRLDMRTLVDWLEVWGMRIVINILVFILLCGSLALIGLTTSKMIEVRKHVCLCVVPTTEFSTYVEKAPLISRSPELKA